MNRRFAPFRTYSARNFFCKKSLYNFFALGYNSNIQFNLKATTEDNAVLLPLSESPRQV